MIKDFEPIPLEISFLKEIIFSPGSHVFFDIDGTLKGPNTSNAPAGFDPELPHLLAKLNEIPSLSVGASTSQSPQELYVFLLKMDSVIDGKLMSGLSILEDGHILVGKGEHMLTDYIELISPEAKAQIAALKNALKKVWKPAQEPNLAKTGWGFFQDVSTPVALPEGKYQGAVTMSIWEKGPNVHDPQYNDEYKAVALFVSSLVQERGAQILEFKEAGNGTLRVVQQGLSKETTLASLATKGIVDLKRTIYVGDGLNDVAPAKLVTEAGGGVIAVANAIPALKKEATYICDKPLSHGVVDTFNLILKK